MSRVLTKTLAVVTLSAGIAGSVASPAVAAPAPAAPVADGGSAAVDLATGSAKLLLAWPVGFILFGACFADGPVQSPEDNNPLCRSLLALTSGSR
ncbi:hypothetical protein ABZ319_18145 [Nocardia sp. NPDC005978]|uniref:hypothetical protein n=1 Tax=Nocardia sp. NPDC005978 TaxID=3156725 RepID=UPI0033A19C0D